MARHAKPNIILEYTNAKTYRSEQVLQADAIFAVFYKGKAINLRSLNSLVNFRWSLNIKKYHFLILDTHSI